MKKFLTLFTLLTLTTILQAQVEVHEGTKSMVEGNYNAYTVVLPNIDKDNAEDTWKDFMKEYKAKVKKDKKAQILFSENVQIPSISANPVDVYASISEEKGKSATVSVWFDTGSGYVNSIDMKAQSETASAIVQEYATNVLRNNAEEIQKEEEKVLKDLKNDSKKLMDKNKDLREDISKAKANILKWEKELEQNEDDIKKKEKSIDVQEEVVTTAKEKTRKY